MSRLKILMTRNAFFTLTLAAFTSMFLAEVPAQARGSKKPKPAPLEDSMPHDSKTTPDHVPGQLLVSFKDGTTGGKRHEIFKKLGLAEKNKVGSTELYLVEVPEQSSLESMIETLKNFPEVRFAEKNVTMKIFKPLDPNGATE